jgi:hypothetical protein
MNLAIDHVSVCGSNLERMRADFAAVGLRTSYGGRHANGMTHMDLLTFPDGSYIELIAPYTSLAGAGGMMSGWAKLMEGDAGCGAWAVRSTDIHAETLRLRSAGIDVRGPEKGSRQRTDGTQLEWETAIVGPGSAGSVLPFLIEDRMPRDLRVPAPTAVSEIDGVAAVVIGVRDLKASIALFHRAFGLKDSSIEEHPDFEATLASFSHTPVILASQTKANSWLADRLRQFGECPAAFLLKTSSEFPTKDLPTTAKPMRWFETQVAFFDPQRLQGVRIGLICQ